MLNLLSALLDDLKLGEVYSHNTDDGSYILTYSWVPDRSMQPPHFKR